MVLNPHHAFDLTEISLMVTVSVNMKNNRHSF